MSEAGSRLWSERPALAAAAREGRRTPVFGMQSTSLAERIVRALALRRAKQILGGRA